MADLLGMTAVLVLCALVVSISAQSPLQYQIFEETATNTFVGNLITDKGLDQAYQSSILARFRFGILPGKYSRYFSVEERSGLLRVNMTFDREVECRKRRECRLDLDVAVVRPAEYFQVIKVQVSVMDQNDNSPEFPSDRVTLAIPESSPLGKPGFSIQEARDRDNGILGVQRYELVSTSPKFALSSVKNVDGSFDLHLILNEALDHEVENMYTLQLVAYDGGSPPNRGTLYIEVHVTDTNDNNPQFEEAAYNVSMLEDIQPFTPIVQVRATDQDQGTNGLITYSLTQETHDLYGHLFHINNGSGELYLSRDPGEDLEESYELVIQAQDRGEDALRAFTKVHILVQDVNNHAPDIKVNTFTSSGHAEVMENTPRNAFVSHLSADDLDRGRNGMVTCSIQDSNFQLVELFTSEYKIVSSVKFDREVVSSYQLMIHCQDNGVPPLPSTRELVVKILDKNDHSPVFSQDSYTKSILENQDPHTPVFILTASDRDVGDNAKVTYSLEDPAAGLNGPPLLDINADTGIVTTLASFDRETRQQYVWRVLAKDGGQPQHTSTATLTLNILDVNDERPFFKQSAYSFGTFENQANGTEIGTLAADDLDLAPYNTYEFSLKPVETRDYGTFQIDRRSGKIRTRKILDREAIPAYYLIATVRDRQNPTLSSTVSVTVYVADKNDNAPIITYPTHNNNTVEVSVYAPIGYIFAKAYAEDADLGNNAKLRYEIAGGNEDGFFDIDPTVGAVFINRPIYQAEESNDNFLKAKSVYLVTILVTDHGSPAKSASTLLRITLNRSEEFAQGGGALQATSAPFALGYHQKIIIILGSVTAVLVAILVAAIFLVKRRQMQHAKETYRHMCRMETAQQLAYNDTLQVGGDRGGSTSKLPGYHGDYVGSKEEPAVNSGQDSRHPCPGLSCYPTLPCRGLVPVPHTSVDDATERLQGLPLFTREQDSESASGCSGDVSNADSGHGPSEEGDAHNTSLCHINPGLGTVGYSGSGRRGNKEKAPVPPPRSRLPGHMTSLGSDINIAHSRLQAVHGPYYGQPLGTFQPQGHPRSNLPDITQGHNPGDGKDCIKDRKENNSSGAPPIPKRQPFTKLSSSTAMPGKQAALLPREPALVASDYDEENMSDCDGGSSTSGSFTVQLEEDTMRSVDV